MSVMDSIEEGYQDRIAALEATVGKHKDFIRDNYPSDHWDLVQEVAALTAERDRLRADAERYKIVRRMTPRQFTDIWRYNLDGAGDDWKTFDELIDALKQTEGGIK